MKRLITLLLALTIFTEIFAQVSVYNLVEFQLGNIPGNEPEDLYTGYDQLNLQYRIKNFRASARVEGFYKTINENDNYAQLSQFLLNYRKKGIEFNLGNFYTTLGKGLLLRGYEIKNSVYENQIYRVRQGFYKDLKGISATYHNRYFSLKALSGKMLNNQLPPFFDEKRTDHINAGKVKLNFIGQSIGVIYLENRNPVINTKYISTLIEGNFLNSFSYYGEYAVISDSNYGYFDFSQENSYGIYLNLNYTTSGFGLSLEYKDYHNFFIGSGLSDPSTLVKEHSYRLLNRSTHVTELYDESGVQAEIFIRPSDKNLITLNYSQALNQFGQDIIFKEFFAELNSEINKSSNLEIFGDYSSDELTLEKHRFASGVNYSHLVNKQKWLLTTEFEFQHVRRNTDFQKSYSNIYGGLIISNSTKFSAVLIWEFTNDKIKADLANTDKIESKRHFPGVNILYKPTSKHTFQLFAGERRGGPACTSGICYEILDFKGIELRITTRL